MRTHDLPPLHPMHLKGYIEKAGTGTEDMIAKCADWDIPAPEWVEDEDDFRVILRRPSGLNAGRAGSGGNAPVPTQQPTQQTTRQTTQRMLLKLLPSRNMRNIVSLVMKNPEINIAGMAHALGLSQDGIKYHIKQIRKRIAFKHVGPWNAGHWEIGPKETP